MACMAASFRNMTTAGKTDATIRKMFACELQHLRLNEDKSRYKLKVEGQEFELRLAWLQGYLRRSLEDLRSPEMTSILGDSDPHDVWLFRDQTASDIPVVLPLELRENLPTALNEACYYSVVVTVAPPDETIVPVGEKLGKNVKLRAKRLINLNHDMFDEEERKKHNEIMEEVWCYEVVHYHRMMCQSGAPDWG